MQSNPQHLCLMMYTIKKLTVQQQGHPWDILQPTCFQYITKVNGLRILNKNLNHSFTVDMQIINSFVIFKKKDHVQKFLRYTNSLHRNIKFACGRKKDNRILFLHISISRNNNTQETSIFRKSTFSGVYTNFNSFLPTEYKRGLLHTLLQTTYNICSSYLQIHEETSKVAVNPQHLKVEVAD